MFLTSDVGLVVQAPLDSLIQALRAFRRAGLCSVGRGLCLVGRWLVGLVDWLAGWLAG